MSSESSSDISTLEESEWDGVTHVDQAEEVDQDEEDFKNEKELPRPPQAKTVYTKFGHSMANVGVTGLGGVAEAETGAAGVDWSVGVAVLCARALVGADLDPTVAVALGGQARRTKRKKATNEPNYDENFIFEMRQPPTVFFDQLLVIEVFHTTRVLHRQVPIGSFKIDMRTVYAQKNHMFFHRFALLLDPLDPLAGPKGYVKVDIVVSRKGEMIKTPTTTDADSDDIDSQILLPADMANSVVEQAPARFRVQVHSAEGLPSLRASLATKLGRAFSSTAAAPPNLLDPHVFVAFAGQSARTKVVKGSSNPVWDEEVVFTEMFPPLVRTIRLHVRDADGDVVATAFLHLNHCSDNSTQGYMPMFGPAYLNLYGGYRSGGSTLTPLNFGMGEGVSFRGRLKISLKVEIEDNITKKGLHNVVVKSIPPLPQEFLLFCTVMEANMIDKRFAGKNLSLEMSIGNEGSGLDGFKPIGYPDDAKSLAASHTDLRDAEPENPKWNSRTPPFKPLVRSKEDPYCNLPFGAQKPCLFILSDWEDQRLRLFRVNQLRKAHRAFEIGLSDTLRLLEMEQLGAGEDKLKKAMDNLLCALNEFLSQAMSGHDHGLHGTPLDRERAAQRQRELAAMCSSISQLKSEAEDILPKLQEAFAVAERLRGLALEVQESLPDVFLWLASGKRRIAFQRFRAEELLASRVPEERGARAQRVSTFFLKVPGRTEVETEDWEIWGQVSAYFWLGLAADRRHYLDDLPSNYSQVCRPLGSADGARPRPIMNPAYQPPAKLTYKESGAFELRCHVFQGRAVMPADDSGLSDPFLRVLFLGESAQTRVCSETVNPVWDECLVLPAVRLYGPPAAVAADPPRIVLQVYDHDSIGSNEFLGQADGWPVVKLAAERYGAPKFPPRLTWLPVYKGRQRAGEILAAFELFHLDKAMRDYPKLDVPERNEEGRLEFKVPTGIRPVLRGYRLEALFWGLRDLKAVGGGKVERAKVEVEIAGRVLESPLLGAYAKGQTNFAQTPNHMEIMLPSEGLYRPPVTLRCLETKLFGRSVLLGTHVIPLIDNFLFRPKGEEIQTATTVEIERDGYANLALMMESASSDEDAAVPIPPYDEDEADSIDSSAHSDTESQRAAFFQSLNGQDPTVQICKPSAAATHATHHSAKTVKSVQFSNGTAPAAKKATTAKVTAEPDDSSDDEKDEGTTRPLPMMPLLVNDEERKRRAKLKEEEKKLDWWSKFHVSLQDIEDIRRAEAPKGTLKIKRRMKKKSRFNRARISAAFSSAAGALAILKDKSKRKLKRTKDEDEEELVAKEPKKQPPALLDKSTIQRLKIYEEELENEFGGFNDIIHSFRLYRGKKTASKFDERNRHVGTFKGNLVLCPLPAPPQIQQHGFFADHPKPENVRCLVRVYVIRALKLHPMDASGKADPYVAVVLGKSRVRDKAHKLIAQLNPVFGRVYELETVIPWGRELTVQVWDWDRVSADDLIGETTVDLEQRLITRRRAHCGLAAKYNKTGYALWRDCRKPTQILAGLCRDYGLSGPFYKPGTVTVHGHTYGLGEADALDSENAALLALRDWAALGGFPLVPEHVERRTLYHPDIPATPMGSVDMWIDIFPQGPPNPNPLPPVDIKPRKPKSYELRVTIWNTMDIILSDINLIGANSVDQYIKGHLLGPDLDSQQTDVHYRSLKGEGMFNWRFVFAFDYLDAEDKIVYKAKQRFYSLSEHEEKIPPKLVLQGVVRATDSCIGFPDIAFTSNKYNNLDKTNLQSAIHEVYVKIKAHIDGIKVWDADTFSADDFLGTLILPLNGLARGAKSDSRCKAAVVEAEPCQLLSLFRIRRTRGWWPLLAPSTGDGPPELAGKVDVELHLLTAEEAAAKPAGPGRDAPEPLPEPQRPETSFSMFTSPLKFLKMTLWDGLKYKILVLFLLILLFFFVAKFVYTIPESIADSIIKG